MNEIKRTRVYNQITPKKQNVKELKFEYHIREHHEDHLKIMGRAEGRPSQIFMLPRLKSSFKYINL